MSPRPNHFVRFIRFSLLAFAGPIIVLVLIGPLIAGGNITKTSLDPEYVPTVENLLENPMPNPHRLRLHVEQNGYNGDKNDVETFCVHLIVPRGHRPDLIHFDFDRNRVWGTFFSGTLEGLSGPEGYLDKFCIGGAVETGLHLVTLHLNDEIFGEPFTYEWAVEINNDGYDYYSIPE